MLFTQGMERARMHISLPFEGKGLSSCGTMVEPKATSHRLHLALIPLGKLSPGKDTLLVDTTQSSSAYADLSGDSFAHAVTDPTGIILSQSNWG